MHQTIHHTRFISFIPLAWAREAGYTSCMVDFMTASRAAPFWRNLGFGPVSYLLRRVVDDRVAWVRA